MGVYDADGGLLGELAYLTGRILGIAHCALCEITHGPAGEKPAFQGTRQSLPGGGAAGAAIDGHVTAVIPSRAKTGNLKPSETKPMQEARLAVKRAVSVDV